jgi:hypothetical protein
MTGVHPSVALEREWLASLRSTRTEDFAELVRAGVPPAGIALAPAQTRIRLCADGLFEPDPDGLPAFVVPVRCESPLTPEAGDPHWAVRDAYVLDLLAFHPQRPGRWALRTGAAEWAGAIEPQHCGPDPVPIWRTPLRWLQAGAVGIVLLGGDPASAYRVLGWCRGGVIAEDVAHAAELRGILSRPWPIPRVFVRRRRDAAA